MSRLHVVLSVVLSALVGLVLTLVRPQERGAAPPRPTSGTSSPHGAGGAGNSAAVPTAAPRPSSARRRRPTPLPPAAPACTDDGGTWVPSDHQLASFAPEYQPHVQSVGAYLNEVFAPRVRDCVAPFEPSGWLEVRHSFSVDADGRARPAAVHGLADDAVAATGTDLDSDTLLRVLDCMDQAAADTSFVHVALFEDAPEAAFIAYQGYDFGPAR